MNVCDSVCRELCLVTEFVDRGNLFDVLHEEDGGARKGVVLGQGIVTGMALDVCRVRLDVKSHALLRVSFA